METSILHYLADAAVLGVARFLFLFFAPADRACLWCKPDSKWCLRCHCTRRHFRLGQRPVNKLKDSIRNIIIERMGRGL